MENNYECVATFHGASAKRAPFRGWAGRVTEWGAKEAPKIEFGVWKRDAASAYNGGVVSFPCKPLALIMFGANSEDMRTRDKTTHFAIAGLAPEGRLRAALLPADCDAREIFAAGGWQAPNVDALAARLVAVTQAGDLTKGQLSDQLNCTLNELCEGFGIARGQLDETLGSWPALAPIKSVLDTAYVKLQLLSDQLKQEHYRRALADVQTAIATLVNDGKEVTARAIAAVITSESDQAHATKEKARKLRKILGPDFAGLLVAVQN